MISVETVREKLAHIEKSYVDFMLTNLADWRKWAEMSELMARGEKVDKKDVPEFFHVEYEWAKVLLEIEDPGSFDWNDPRISKLFAAVAEIPFYKVWGDAIVNISMILADIFGLNTFLEIGAGRANLTSIMMKKMTENKSAQKLISTDAHPAVLENIGKLDKEFPEISHESLLWDINNPPPDELSKKLIPPTLVYERASITYTNFTSIKNLSLASDVLVLGDYFNYTGELFEYDRISEKIGVIPLMYDDLKKVLDDCYPNQYIVDRVIVDKLGIPNVTLLIAWK
ncbi:hypothetical protein ACFL20_09770 [Spirochaetota bacterium]